MTDDVFDHVLVYMPVGYHYLPNNPNPKAPESNPTHDNPIPDRASERSE